MNIQDISGYGISCFFSFMSRRRAKSCSHLFSPLTATYEAFIGESSTTASSGSGGSAIDDELAKMRKKLKVLLGLKGLKLSLVGEEKDEEILLMEEIRLTTRDV